MARSPGQIITQTVSRTYVRYAALIEAALEELKIGGDTAKAEVLARLAQAEATVLCEPEGA